jgi:hypothetical protein
MKFTHHNLDTLLWLASGWAERGLSVVVSAATALDYTGMRQYTAEVTSG